MSQIFNHPKLVRTITELREKIADARHNNRTIGLVPTMGALHEGHISLVKASCDECDFTIATVFVNPTQFAPHEDLDAYPRTLEADIQKLAKIGVDLVFAPSSEEIYNSDHTSWVTVDSVSKPLEGIDRPTHFRGVATIVLKLFNITQSDVAYFGQKDYQQTLVIKKMVGDLNIPTTIRVCPIVREPDGLAMSSRNTYLSPQARQKATVLYQSLCLAKQLIKAGQRDSATIITQMQQLIQNVEDAQINYITIADAQTLQPITDIPNKLDTGSTLVIALAVKIDGTRLIDNMILPE